MVVAIVRHAEVDRYNVEEWGIGQRHTPCAEIVGDVEADLVRARRERLARAQFRAAAVGVGLSVVQQCAIVPQRQFHAARRLTARRVEDVGAQAAHAGVPIIRSRLTPPSGMMLSRTKRTGPRSASPSRKTWT